MMLEKMQNEPGFTEVIEKPMFVYYSNCPSVLPYFLIKGKYMQGGNLMIYAARIYSLFCPFCGKKYKKL
jgi:hypothetical protein